MEDIAHMLHTTDPLQWIRWFVTPDTEFRLTEWSKTFNMLNANEDNSASAGSEVVYMFTLPDDPQYDNWHLLRWHEDMTTTHIGECDG